MHHIQRKILASLLYAVSLPYSAMRPERVESNHFAYHLEQLIRSGYVTKQDRRYCLSAKGLQIIDRMSQEGMQERVQPHIVSVIDITNEAGQTLLFKRFFQPHIFQYSLILGKTHYEETLMEAAEREVFEKTGLVLTGLRNRGTMYLDMRLDGMTVSKKLCHILSVQLTGSPQAAPLNPIRGECAWIDHTILLPNQAMCGLFAMKALLAEHEDVLFFAERTEEMTVSPEALAAS
jgi:ADP-ribose pyrophosphatase YjhB (NUDIX family)